METSNYMDVKMVSEYLHVAKSTIYCWTSQNSIPHVKLAGGKRTLYIKDQIDSWVLNSGVISDDIPNFPKI